MRARGFDGPVYLINLDRCPERLVYMQSQAERIGLGFERVPAVVGRAAPPDLAPQFFDEDGKPLLLDGHIGCYASHLGIYQRIVAEKTPHTLVLEDDVGLEPDLAAAANAAVAAAPAGWDFIQLSGLIRRVVYSVADLPNGRHLVRHMRIPMNTGGYIVSRAGAEKMLVPAPRLRQIDLEIHFGWIRKLDVWGVYPSPVIWSQTFPSEIDFTPVNKAARHPEANTLTRIEGHLYAARKLGWSGYFACRRAGMRRTSQPRGVHVVMSSRARRSGER